MAPGPLQAVAGGCVGGPGAPPRTPPPSRGRPRGRGRGDGGDARSRVHRAGPARRGREVQGVPGSRGAGRPGRRPARRGWGPESPWAPARNTQLIITSRKTPRPRPPETPALRNPPQSAPPWPHALCSPPLGVSLSSPQVPALGHHPRREGTDHGSDSPGEGRPGLPQLPEQSAAGASHSQPCDLSDSPRWSWV